VFRENRSDTTTADETNAETCEDPLATDTPHLDGTVLLFLVNTTTSSGGTPR
jgi:hypothetical protein